MPHGSVIAVLDAEDDTRQYNRDAMSRRGAVMNATVHRAGFIRGLSPVLPGALEIFAADFGDRIVRSGKDRAEEVSTLGLVRDILDALARLRFLGATPTARPRPVSPSARSGPRLSKRQLCTAYTRS